MAATGQLLQPVFPTNKISAPLPSWTVFYRFSAIWIIVGLFGYLRPCLPSSGVLLGCMMIVMAWLETKKAEN